MKLFGKVNHNNLANRAEQGARKKLGTQKLPSVGKLATGKGTVKNVSAGQQRKAKWS